MAKVAFKFDSASLIAGLTQLGEGIKEDIRPSTQAGAQVLYDEVLTRVPESSEGHWFYGTHKKYWFDSGTLKKSIYQVFSKSNSTDTKATYHIAWNHRTAPYGFMVHNGTSNAPAKPFLFEAYDKAATPALQAAKTRLAFRIQQRLAGIKT